MLAQAPQPAIGGYIEPFHDLVRTHIAHSRQCFQDVDDFGVSDDVVIFGEVENLGKAALAGAESLLHLSAAASSLGRGMPCLLALLVAQGGNRHSCPHLAAGKFSSALLARPTLAVPLSIRPIRANQSEI
jgi:hypothetical protein